MEKGILFSKADRPTIEYRKTYTFDVSCPGFGEAVDGNNHEVTREEARQYDAIMEQIIDPNFF